MKKLSVVVLVLLLGFSNANAQDDEVNPITTAAQQKQERQQQNITDCVPIHFTRLIHFMLLKSVRTNISN